MRNPDLQQTRENEPIPMSPSVAWEEFRQTRLPPLVFTGAVIAAACLWSNYVAPKPVAASPQPPLPALTNAWPGEDR